MRTEQFPAVAAELVKAQVDAIVAGGAAAARAAQAATRTIPILTLTDDMVGQGLVASLARPGGNTTGISILATELDGKRQEILMEMVPAARRMAVLADANTAAPQNMRALQEATRARGVELAVHLVERPERIVPEIEEARRAGAEALNVLASPILYARRLDIFERTAALRLPAIYQSPEFAEEGGLIGYGPRITQMFRQMARQLAKVFKARRSVTCRSSSRPVRVGDQPAGRQGDRFRGATIARAARRQGDRMKRTAISSHAFCCAAVRACCRRARSSRQCRWSGL